MCVWAFSAGLLFLAVIDKRDVIFCSVHARFNDNIQLIILLEHAVKRATISAARAYTSCDVMAWLPHPTRRLRGALTGGTLLDHVIFKSFACNRRMS